MLHAAHMLCSLVRVGQQWQCHAAFVAATLTTYARQVENATCACAVQASVQDMRKPAQQCVCACLFACIVSYYDAQSPGVWHVAASLLCAGQHEELLLEAWGLLRAWTLPSCPLGPNVAHLYTTGKACVLCDRQDMTSMTAWRMVAPSVPTFPASLL
jgi:hypothetical protein